MNAQGLSRALARLNHIFIPDTKEARDRARSLAPVRAARPLVWLYKALTDEGRTLSVLLILVGTMSMDLATTQGYWLWSFVTGVILAGLLMRPAYTLHQVQLAVSAPRQVTVGEVLQFELSLHNTGTRDYGVIRIDRPLLTWDGSWVEGPPSLLKLPAGERRTVRTEARFVQRGHHHLDNFWAAALTPGGLSQGRRIGSGGLHFVAVPPIAKISRLRLREGSRYQQGGVALASTTGESMELMGVRPYRRGDSVRDLHARSWARRGQPVVREYHQEYFTRVGVVLDTDAAEAGQPALEAGISLAAGVIAHLTRGESLIDVLVTGDRLHALTVGRSLGFLDQALDHLACVAAGPPLEPTRTLGILGPYLDRLSCVVLITLRGDPARQQLASAVRGQGVGCRVLQLDPAHSGDEGPDLSRVAIADIDPNKGLLL